MHKESNNRDLFNWHTKGPYQISVWQILHRFIPMDKEGIEFSPTHRQENSLTYLPQENVAHPAFSFSFPFSSNPWQSGCPQGPVSNMQNLWTKGTKTNNNNNNPTERLISRFVTTSSLRRELSQTCMLKSQVQSCANHVQHTEPSLCATCVPLGTKGQLS